MFTFLTRNIVTDYLKEYLSTVGPDFVNLVEFEASLDLDSKWGLIGEGNATCGECAMKVLSLYTVLKRYGGMRHPKIESYEIWRQQGHLVRTKHVPEGATIFYVSHEWVGTDHPDPRGDQFYHLLLLLERLMNGEVSRTDMDAFHSILYKQNFTTTAEDWKHMLDPQKTYIFYDGFCVPKMKREEAFRMI